MTMPARRASRFCARSRSQYPEMFFLKLISLVIPGMMNLGQNVTLKNPGSDADDDDGDSGGDEPTTATPHSHRQANTHRDQISRSGKTPLL